MSMKQEIDDGHAPLLKGVGEQNQYSRLLIKVETE